MNELVELRKQRNAQLDRMAIPYYEGDVDALKKGYEEARGESSKESEVELKRQTCLTDHIDACLQALEKVDRGSDEEFPKAFFGVGTAHLITDVVGEDRTVSNVIDGLRQKGWELEYERE